MIGFLGSKKGAAEPSGCELGRKVQRARACESQVNGGLARGLNDDAVAGLWQAGAVGLGATHARTDDSAVG